MEKGTKIGFRKKGSNKFNVKQKFGVKKKSSIIENEKIKTLKEAYKEYYETSKEEMTLSWRCHDQTRLYQMQMHCYQSLNYQIVQSVSKFIHHNHPLGKMEHEALQASTEDVKLVMGVQALREASYLIPTKIQKESIGLALQGRDILGAAKTGSGKTLAFLIPVLEHLYCEKWSSADGLGALIISPTRELAYQIFEVLRKVGKYHDFSAGLVIGGKHVREEADRINRTNIVICTPGRMLQHMDETAYFNADNLKILVLDEADRILDLGFQQTMNAIIQNLPSERQTLLFSATQTKSVKDLARLSLKDPMYVSVHEHAQYSTPTQLAQSYLVCELSEKINLVWSFVKHHLKTKTLIFLASCKQDHIITVMTKDFAKICHALQVRFVYEVFRRMKPGVTVLSLHGAMQQMKRMAVYESFCRKQFAVLFATDIAARGLDFPAVNWVIQFDCPEDANTYIHRVGRTARYEKDGEALLILLPSEEEAMVSDLQAKKIPINKIKANPNKQRDIRPKMESMLAADVQLKEFAQRAFVSYLKSVFFMSNKKIFDVTMLDLEGFARSLGLALTPRVRFIEKEKNKRLQQQKFDKSAIKSDMNKLNRTSKINKVSAANSGSEQSTDEEMNSPSNEESDSEDSSDVTEGDVKSDEKSKRSGLNFGQEMEEDDDLFKVKRSSESIHISSGEEEEATGIADTIRGRNKKVTTKYAQAKKVLKKKLKVNSKIIFDEEGKEIQDVCRKPQSVPEDDDNTEGGIDITKARQRLAEEDKYDKKLYRQRIKQMHQEKRLKEKRKKKVPEEEEVGVELADIEDQSDLDQGSVQQVSSNEHNSGSEASADWDSADYSDFSEPSPPTKKRKFDRQRSSLSSDEGVSEDEGDAVETGHSLVDDEMFALRLLQKS
ncbi:hypothetical protein LSH36_1186g00002 [Paralvinella palmiformis]|uniref:ATP-dependent RNA helicase n=1 Tax=Paralvinella palmiformis TaxID=53620 RepID=A0AAD9MRC3_9ANNE|nr:hypothetical protein LSH36_1186g00002 [Paralvinella palmiformis]